LTLAPRNNLARYIYGAVFSRDGSRILTWSDDWTVRLWAVGQNEPLQTFAHEGGVKGAVFNRDESRILTWSDDGTARLWVVGQTSRSRPFAHARRVNGAVFNPDESRILTWSGDGTARLWDISLDEKIPPDERILRSDEVLRIKMRIDRFPIGP
jgi:WD40 repeat protein